MATWKTQQALRQPSTFFFFFSFFFLFRSGSSSFFFFFFLWSESDGVSVGDIESLLSIRSIAMNLKAAGNPAPGAQLFSWVQKGYRGAGRAAAKSLLVQEMSRHELLGELWASRGTKCFSPGGTGSWVRLCLCLCLFFFLGGWMCIRRHCSGNWGDERVQVNRGNWTENFHCAF